MAYSGTYAEASPSNPSGAQTSYSFVVDASQLDSDWWNSIDTTDYTKGRAEDSGGTELPCAWIDINTTAQTGVIVFKADKSITTESFKIFSPLASRDSYASTDTYGSQAAFSDNYIPLIENLDDIFDSSSYTTSGITAGDSTGQLGSASEFSGTGSYLVFSETFDYSTDWTISLLTQFNTNTADRNIFGADVASGDIPRAWADYSGSLLRPAWWTGYADQEYGSTEFVIDSWYHVVVQHDSSDDSIKFYVNGASEFDVTTSSAGLVSTSLYIGANSTGGKTTDQQMQHIQVRSSVEDSNWISYQSDMYTDNTTFWGGWTTTVPEITGDFIFKTNYSGGLPSLLNGGF